MRDPQFFKEHNARHFWHPMAHPAEMLKNPPIVVASAEGVEITDNARCRRRAVERQPGLFLPADQGCDNRAAGDTALLHFLPWNL